MKHFKSIRHFLASRPRRALWAFLFAVFVVVPVSFLLFHKKIQAAWFDENWHYRKAVAVTNSGSAETDFQVSFTLDTTDTTKFKSDCSDIRVTDSNGDILGHWIEENNPGCGNAATKIWTKIPSLPAGASTVYVYYGNPLAANTGDGDKVFDFFDDFSNFNSNRWTATGGYSVSGEAMTVTTGAVYTNDTILSTAQNYIYEYRAKWSGTNASYSGVKISESQTNQAGNSGSNELVHFTTDNWSLNNIACAADGTSATYNIANCVTQYTAVADTYYVDGFSIDSSNVRYYHNRSQTNLYAGTWVSAPYIWIGDYKGKGSTSGDNGRDITVDWVLARKYASSEPTLSASSTEEKSVAPIAYWAFDEGEGSTAHDESVYRNDGTLGTGTSAPSWKPESECVSGKCLSFDGNDYITVSDTSTLSSTVQTFSLWFNTKDLNDDRTLIANNNGSSYALPSLVRIESSKIQYYSNSHTASTQKVFTADTWYHLVVIADSSADTVTFYVNGALDSVNNTGNIISSSDAYPYSIGAWSYNNSKYGQFWNGKIDEVKIYNYARSAVQIKADYNAGLSGMGKAKEGAAAAFGGRSDKWLTDGLVGYWKMDESTGTAVQDYSGNSNNGTWFGSGTHPVTGKFGNGGGFNGTDDTINTGSNSSLDDIQNQGGGGMTLAFWIKSGTNPNSYIMAKGNGSGGSGSWSIMQNGSGNTGRLTFAKEGATDKNWAWNSALTAGTWQYVVITWDGTMVNAGAKTYINSSLLAQPTTSNGATPNSDSAYNLYFGSLNGSSSYSDINMDDVRIYNRALSPNEVQRLYNWAPGPVGHWKMDDRLSGDSKTIVDSSGNGNNGVTSDGANNTGMDCTKPGKYGNACEFDGADDNIIAGTGSSLNIYTSGLTLEAWVKPSTLSKGTASQIISKGGDANFYRMTFNDGGTVSLRTFGTSDNTLASSSALMVNNWNHVVMTYDGATKKIYLNGNLNASEATTGIMSYTIATMYIGGYGSSEQFPGSIDDVRIYNYARTQKQILEDMHGGQPGLYPIASYDFNEGVGGTVYNSGYGGTTLNGNLGTGTSAPTWSNDGKFGKALSFDGNDDVSVIRNTSVEPTTVSVSAWIKTTNLGSNYPYIISKPVSAGSTSYGLYKNTANSTYAFYINDGNEKISPTIDKSRIEDGNWHYLSGTYDKSFVRFYVDGVQVGTGTATTADIAYSASYNLHIGSFNNNYFSSGTIDDVKIYNYALTADEVKMDYDRGMSAQMGSVGGTSGTGAASNSAGAEYCVPGDSTSCVAPVVEWKMDEKTGTTAYDTSGNGNNGTLGTGSSAPTWASGKYGGGLSFDGAGDYVSAYFSNINGANTTSFWIRNINLVNNANVVSLGLFQNFYYSDQGGGSRLWFITDGTVNGSASTLCLNNNTDWHYIVGVSNGSNSQLLYCDGELVSQASESPSGNLADIRIGGGVAGAYSNEIVDQVRIYNYARSASQIAWEYNHGKPVAEWRMNECQGGTVHDESGNGNNGTISLGSSGTQTTTLGNGTCITAGSTPWYNGRSGKYGGCLNFDGTDDAVSSDNWFLLPNYPSGTVSLWVNPTTISEGTKFFFGARDSYSGNSRVDIYRNNSDVVFGLGDSSALITSSSALSAGTWYFFTLVWDNGNATAYINSNQVGTGSFSSNSAGGSARLDLGAEPIGGDLYNYGNSKIDDVKIFNYALTAEQVKTLYNNSSAVSFGN